MKNSTVYCLVNVCSCFVIIFKSYIFQTTLNSAYVVRREGLGGCGIADG